MATTQDELASLATAVGFDVPPEHAADYLVLLDRAKAAFAAVEAMDGRAWAGWGREEMNVD